MCCRGARPAVMKKRLTPAPSKYQGEKERYRFASTQRPRFISAGKFSHFCASSLTKIYCDESKRARARAHRTPFFFIATRLLRNRFGNICRFMTQIWGSACFLMVRALSTQLKINFRPFIFLQTLNAHQSVERLLLEIPCNRDQRAENFFHHQQEVPRQKISGEINFKVLPILSNYIEGISAKIS